MDKQDAPSTPVGQKPSSYDIPSMIVIYTLVIVLGVGLCFCLRKANRLVPNRYSFPLILRGGGGNDDGNRQRSHQNQFNTIDDEESRQGLLNDFSDQDDSDGEHEQVDTHRYQHDSIQNLNDHNDNDDLEGDEFGDLQGANDSDNNEVLSGVRQKSKKLA